MHRAKLALAGVGGFGKVHVTAALRLANEGLVHITAFAEPNDHHAAVSPLAAIGIRRYRDYREMLETETDLQLVSIAAPIPCHYPMAMAVIERGLHLFLEKPPAVTIQHLREIVATQRRTGSMCAVNFHDMANPTMVTLKRRLCEGVIGTVRAIRAEARQLRTDAYYTRNAWAGQVRREGDWVLDGPLNTSGAHVLNTCAYLADDELHEFARPTSVQAELYRAKPFPCEDTSCLRATMDTGVEVSIYLTHCASQEQPRAWRIIGDKGTILLDDANGVILPDGTRIPMEEPGPPTVTLMRRLVEVIQESDEPLLMPLAESEGYLLLANGAYESAGRIVPLPEEAFERRSVGDSTATVIKDIDTIIPRAAQEGKLLSELGVPWAQPTTPWDLDAYVAFPTRWTG